MAQTLTNQFWDGREREVGIWGESGAKMKVAEMGDNADAKSGREAVETVKIVGRFNDIAMISI